MSHHHTAIRKFLSFVLRHQPDAIGITLDVEGWVDMTLLITAAAKEGKTLDLDLIRQVVATSDKRRFSISEDGLRIRAVQGHSAKSVDIQFAEQEPPEFLYHGTTTRFLDSIYKEGLLSGSRQYVHLSQDEQTALAVGRRHGQPVVLVVNALLMHGLGFKFYRAENGVWLTSGVPVKFISEKNSK
jgi:putative RNA 2'-phosphotransferase